jgi:hypothetical protein
MKVDSKMCIVICVNHQEFSCRACQSYSLTLFESLKLCYIQRIEASRFLMCDRNTWHFIDLEIGSVLFAFN